MAVKKTISILLILALICALPLSAAAEEALPESEHPYARNCELTWTYEYPGETDGLFVTFSPDTFFAYDLLSENYDEEAAAILEETGFYENQWDYLRIDYGENSAFYYGTFCEDELAGRTIYLPSNRFTLTLYAQSFASAYGFQITSILANEVPAGNAVVNYHLTGVYVIVVVIGNYSNNVICTAFLC